MKRGILIISLFLISLLVISGCEELQDEILECMVNYQEYEYCSNFDLNEDGFVNILDLVIANSERSFDFTGQDIGGRGATMTIQGISSTSGAGTLDIYVESTADIYGFQFSLTGLYVSGTLGGIATASGYNFAIGCDGECVAAFNFAGDPILTSSMPGVLVVISYSDHYGGEVCFKEGEGDNGPYNIVSAEGGVELTTTWIDNCGGEGVSGCNEPDACNYDPDATIPDGSCEYAEDNFDCDGNCLEDTDCAGVCGGSAYVDNCGVCDIYSSNDDSTCTGCTDQNACNYDSDAIVPCTSLLTTSVQKESKEESSFWHRFVTWWMQFKVNENIQRSDVDVEEVTGDLRENECCEYPADYPDNIYGCDGNCLMDTDCTGICNGNAVEDCAGVCDGSNICACTDDSACNYNPTATNDDGSCTYPEENYDCNGNCVAGFDCNNVCGGSAEEDCSGECSGSAIIDVCGECGGGIENAEDCGNIICDGEGEPSYPEYLDGDSTNGGCWCDSSEDLLISCKFNYDYLESIGLGGYPSGFDIGLEQDLYFIPWNTEEKRYCRAMLGIFEEYYITSENIQYGTASDDEDYYGFFDTELSPPCNNNDAACDEDNIGNWWLLATEDQWSHIPRELYLLETTCRFQACNNVGDLNGDGGHNVLDIIILANCVLVDSCQDHEASCAADTNGDGGWNVLDIVELVNCVLAENCDT